MKISLSPKSTLGMSLPMPVRRSRPDALPGSATLLALALIARVSEQYRLVDVIGLREPREEVVGSIGRIIGAFIDEHCRRQPSGRYAAAPELCGIGYQFKVAADAARDHPLGQPFADAAARFFQAGGLKTSMAA